MLAQCCQFVQLFCRFRCKYDVAAYCKNSVLTVRCQITSNFTVLTKKAALSCCAENLQIRGISFLLKKTISKINAVLSLSARTLQKQRIRYLMPLSIQKCRQFDVYVMKTVRWQITSKNVKVERLFSLCGVATYGKNYKYNRFGVCVTITPF